MRLTDAERKVMKILWEDGPKTAKVLVADLYESTKWRKTTSYTMISRCLDKGYLRRDEPNFLCTPLITKEEISWKETDELLKNDFQDSPELLVASLLKRGLITPEALEKLR